MADECIREIGLGGGETLPIIGIVGEAPPVLPTVYATAVLRMGGRSPNTVSAHLRAIISARRWAALRGFSLEERLTAGRTLEESEIDDLVRVLQTRKPDLKEPALDPGPAGRRSGAEALRRVPKSPPTPLDPTFASNKVRFVRDYLVWLLRRLTRADVLGDAERLHEAFSARAHGSEVMPLDAPMGLEVEQRKQLLAIVQRDAVENPFKISKVRLRNELMVRVLYATGMRRGELAGIKVRDVNSAKATIAVHQRGNDPDETRANAPRAKTLAREVPCSADLIRDLTAYILEVRRQHPAAKRHPFLFVGHHGPNCGEPLSHRQIGKSFEVLKEAAGFGLHAHLLRHDWNDRYSEMRDAEPGTRNDVEEERVRNNLMGWTQGSKMGARYSHRHIKKASDKAMIKMSKGLIDDK